MAQAKLPDINAALVTHRQVALMAYSQHDFRKCQIAIMAMIALMPKEYQVVIDNTEYQKETDKKKELVCTNCNEQTEYELVKINKIRNTQSIYILTGKKYEDYWLCPNCNHLIKSDDTELKNKVFEKPFYHKVLPDPPIKQNIFDRYNYTKKWREWLQLAMSEVEHQIALCRTEYEPDDDNYEQDPDDTDKTQEDQDEDN